MIEGLYGIVDVPHPYGLSAANVTEAVLGDRLQGGSSGAAVVQLRAKSASTDDRTALAVSMLAPCRRAGVPLLVDDDVVAAIASDADGVHVGQGDPGFDAVDELRARARQAGRSRFFVGVSTHDLVQLRAADRRAPDYVAYGPVAGTRSKRDPDPVVGIAGLTDACRIASRPVVAIGGLDADLGAAAIEVGASAVAVIGALVHEQPASIRARAIELSRRFAAAACPRTLPQVAAAIPVLDVDLLEDLARWGDSLGVHLQLGLPARFRPTLVHGQARYRPCDVVDLLYALDKHPDETWEQWRARGLADRPELVRLRTRPK